MAVCNIKSYGADFTQMVKKFTSRDDFCLEVTLTDLCNMNCSYCFEHCSYDFEEQWYKQQSETLDISSIIRCVHNVVESDDFQRRYKNLNLTMWGGEPTLKSRKIIKLIKEFGNNPAISWYVYTNGTLRNGLHDIANEIIRYGAEKRASFQFSWDGDPIHAMRREDNSDIVKDNFLMIYHSGIHSTFKACILPEDFHLMVQAWDSYCAFIEDNFGTYCQDIDIAYVPTIDQLLINPPEQYFEDFEKAITAISAKEIEYTKRHKRHLLSWYGGDMRACPYRRNMACIGTDGTIYSCHGVPYSTERMKRDETIGHVDDISWFHKYIIEKTHDTIFPDQCLMCKATYCAKCSVQCAAISNKDSKIERWYDRKMQDGLCKFYEIFGAYDKAVHTIMIQGYD